MTRALTVKQRKFVKHYVESGNATQAALAAYNTADPHTASAIAAETLEKPGVQQAVAELLDANGLSDGKLLEIHARFLTLHASREPQEKALALKALDMAYRLKGAYAPAREDGEVSLYALVRKMTVEELEDFLERKIFPERLRDEGMRVVARLQSAAGRM